MNHLSLALWYKFTGLIYVFVLCEKFPRHMYSHGVIWESFKHSFDMCRGSRHLRKALVVKMREEEVTITFSSQ